MDFKIYNLYLHSYCTIIVWEQTQSDSVSSWSLDSRGPQSSAWGYNWSDREDNCDTKENRKQTYSGPWMVSFKPCPLSLSSLALKYWGNSSLWTCLGLNSM